MSQSEQTDQIWAALAAAQGMMKNAAFDAVNPHFKNRYATLAAVTDTTREALSKNGIAVTHTNDLAGEQELLVTTFGHKSGQWISSTRRVPAGLKAQEYGAWLTYNRRYALCSMAGISADEDDDGNIAQAASNGKRQNPHVNRPEDFAENLAAYDDNGEPIDNIPRFHGEAQLRRLSKSEGRPEYGSLTTQLRDIQSLDLLRKWFNNPKIIERVHTLPDDWQMDLRNLCEAKKKELSGAPSTRIG